MFAGPRVTTADRVEAMVISACPGLGETANLGLRHGRDMSRQNAGRVADQLFYDRSVLSEEMIERSYAIARDRRCASNMLGYAPTRLRFCDEGSYNRDTWSPARAFFVRPPRM